MLGADGEVEVCGTPATPSVSVGQGAAPGSGTLSCQAGQPLDCPHHASSTTPGVPHPHHWSMAGSGGREPAAVNEHLASQCPK